ncbi:hypothetical protein GGR56DRAFT_674535 [Xylariaceae sp. FL0804]|nr:hypothetical protein GGR56DRAFT_674535 [Xylariaceae sp. FL0804]
MQFSSLLAATSTVLALGASASPITTMLHRQRREAELTRLGQFRIFSADGCAADNEGFYTIDDDQANQCLSLDASEGAAAAPVVRSAWLEELTSAADGCTFYLYTGGACDSGRVALGKSNIDQCMNADATVGASNGTAAYNSYSLSCPDLEA